MFFFVKSFRSTFRYYLGTFCQDDGGRRAPEAHPRGKPRKSHGLGQEPFAKKLCFYVFFLLFIKTKQKQLKGLQVDLRSEASARCSLLGSCRCNICRGSMLTYRNPEI